MPAYTTGTRRHKDGGAIVVRREPWWTYLIHALVDLLCQVTLHHWCNSKLMHWAIKLSDRHTDSFIFPTDDIRVTGYERWRGWRDWDTDDDTADDGE